MLLGQQQQQGADIRAKFTSIDYRHARNLDDYISRCRQVESLLPLLDSFYQQSDATIRRLRSQHVNDPDFQRLADFYSNLNSLDRSALKLVRQEMGLASQLSQLPTGRRLAFFNDRIVPIERMQDRIGEREVQIAREGKRNGVSLPPDVNNSLSKTK